VLELLLAVLLTLALLGATKLTVFSTVTPLAKLSKLGMSWKVTMPVSALYVPPGERTTDVKLGRMVSVIVTSVAVLGPMFVVEILYSTVEPRVAVAGPVLVVTRSAWGVIFVLTVAELLAGVGSGVLELLLAVLLTLPELGATKLTVFSTVTPLAKLSKLGMSWKVTMPVSALYVPPGERTTDGTRGAMVSVIVTSVAVLGPMFVVEIV
jgi:hypothetical protein